jgi:hypothetical protein
MFRNIDDLKSARAAVSVFGRGALIPNSMMSDCKRVRGSFGCGFDKNLVFVGL